MKKFKYEKISTACEKKGRVSILAGARLPLAAAIMAFGLLFASPTPQRHVLFPVSAIRIENRVNPAIPSQYSLALEAPATSLPLDSNHEGRRDIASVSKQVASLAAVFDRLASGADAGDAVSACMLYRGLARCREVETMKIDAADRFEEAARREAGSDDERRLLAMIGEMDSEARKNSILCDGLSAEQLDETNKRMYQAARLGDPQAMARFALYAGRQRKRESPNGSFENVYRTQAVEMLERSASMGNISALRALYNVYLFGRLPNGSKFNDGKTDAVAAAAIGNVLLDSLGKEQDLLIGLSVDDESTAKAMNSSRYHSLRRKYSGYVHEFMLRKMDSGESHHFASCDTQGAGLSI